MNERISIDLRWLMKNHPRVWLEWDNIRQEELKAEAERIREQFEKVEHWLSEWDDERTKYIKEAIQANIDMYNKDELGHATYWNAIRNLAHGHPNWPIRRGEEE